VDQEIPPIPSGPPQNRFYVPGSIDDKMTMLLYYIPACIREQAVAPSFDDFRPLADAMVDYVLFEPRVWRDVCLDGTLEEFLSTAMYQIVCRVRKDPDLGDAYPAFEWDWRRSLATRLNHTLQTPPMALCPNIHRVIPIGVSSRDAMQAMQIAIPKDIKNPYAITVKTSAVDDRCGTIAITQPMRYTIVHINCVLDPDILVDVCRELRSGYRAVVSEVHALKNKHDETKTQLCAVQGQLAVIQTEMRMLVKTLMNTNVKDQGLDTTGPEPSRCSRTGCSHIVTKRFRSGKRQKQCVSCLTYGTRRQGRT
jgi:hypothetical protein